MTHYLSFLKCCCFSLILASFLPITALSATPLQEQFDSYFEEIKKNVEHMSTASVMKRSALSPVDAYFVAQLKKNQPVYALMRTNSKGVIVNEVVRTEKPSRDYRNVASQHWFKYVTKKREPYYGLLKEENGRYHLFWAVPLLKKEKNGTPKFVGAIAAKIDLWDCFHKKASDLDEPFLVRLGNLSLYSNKWEKTKGWTEQALTIPGIDKITIRYKKVIPIEETAEGQALTALRKDTAVITAPVFAIDSSKDKKIGWPFELKIGKYRLMAVGLVLLIIPGVLAFRFYFWFKNWLIMQRLKREDRF